MTRRHVASDSQTFDMDPFKDIAGRLARGKGAGPGAGLIVGGLALGYGLLKSMYTGE